jgi:cathepsin C
MMEELYNNGPFVVSFEPEYDFILYKSGIYHKVENNLVTPPGDKPEWEKVDHSVLIVGWGEDELTREKFWLVQNTWGPDWGESGFFRIRRGIDESAIESICEVGTPIIIDNSTNVTLLPSKKFIPRKHPIIFKKDYLH